MNLWQTIIPKLNSLFLLLPLRYIMPLLFHGDDIEGIGNLSEGVSVLPPKTKTLDKSIKCEKNSIVKIWAIPKDFLEHSLHIFKVLESRKIVSRKGCASLKPKAKYLWPFASQSSCSTQLALGKTFFAANQNNYSNKMLFVCFKGGSVNTLPDKSNPYLQSSLWAQRFLHTQKSWLSPIQWRRRHSFLDLRMQQNTIS